MSVTRSVVFFAFAFFCGSCAGLPYRSLGYNFFKSVYGWMRLETEPTDWLTARINCHMQGYEFSEETGRCYKFHENAVDSWDDAKRTCIEEGGQLAIINSKEEAQVLSALFKRYPPSKIFGAPYPDTAAVGVYKRDNFYFTNNWRTVEGETLEDAGYASWATNSPHPLATYGFINRDGLLYGYVPAIRGFPFICEKNPMDLNDMLSSTSDVVTEEATEEPVSSAPELCETPDGQVALFMCQKEPITYRI